MNTNFFRKHLVLSTFLSIIVCFIISVAIGQVIGSVICSVIGLDTQEIGGRYLAYAIGKIFAIVVTIILVRAAGLLKGIATVQGRLKNAKFLFVVIIVVCLYNVIGDGIASRGFSYTEFHPIALLTCALYAFATGVLEELVCRVLLFQNMCVKWRNKENGILQALLVSSLVFGASHLLNLPAGVGITLFQVFYAVMMGIVFAAMYYLTKNIWTSIISHFMIDFCGVVGYAFMPNKNAMELAGAMSTIDLSAVVIVAFITIGAVHALYIMTKHKSTGGK